MAIIGEIMGSTKDAILKAIEQETGKSIKAITKEKGIYRQIAMELLYRLGGLKGEEIGEIMGVGYTSVSQERRRLQERLSKDRRLKQWNNGNNGNKGTMGEQWGTREQWGTMGEQWGQT